MIDWRFRLGLALTALAGAVDAESFLRFGAVYASFMSGNTVQIGLHVARMSLAPLAGAAALVACFALGGFVGSVLLAKLGPRHLPAILALESAALALAFGLEGAAAPTLAVCAPLSLAMGAQNNLVVLVRGANPGTTFVTGTAFRFSDALAQRVLGRDPHGAWRLHLAVWLAFAIGAALGTGSEVALGPLALAPLVAVAVGLALLSAIVGRSRPA